MRLEPCQVYAVGIDGLVSALTDPKRYNSRKGNDLPLGMIGVLVTSDKLSAHNVDDEDRNVTDGIEDSRNQ